MTQNNNVNPDKEPKVIYFDVKDIPSEKVSDDISDDKVRIIGGNNDMGLTDIDEITNPQQAPKQEPVVIDFTEQDVPSNKEDDMSDDEIRIIGGADHRNTYFCKKFIATCQHFKDTSLCHNGKCVHADKHVPAGAERVSMQLSQMRRAQLKIMRMLQIMNNNKTK